MKTEVEVYASDIDYYLGEYIDSRNLDRNKIPSSQWAAAMVYIHDHVFTDADALRQENRINNRQYDLDAVEKLLRKYCFLCMDFNQRICVEHFSLLSGISKTVISYWANDVRRSGDARAKRIYETLLENSVMAADDMVVSRTGINSIAYSNRIHDRYDAYMSKQKDNNVLDMVDLAERLGIADKVNANALPDKGLPSGDVAEVEEKRPAWMDFPDDADLNF